ncbi:DUF4817 domain-containing protein [Trichonephila clavipes]|nr:DUF4817 domain-containing protein [Trichonephila clavipes]
MLHVKSVEAQIPFVAAVRYLALYLTKLDLGATDGARLLGNEVADDLAKAATSNPVNPEDHMVLTSTEIYSRAKELICRTWVVLPVHPRLFLWGYVKSLVYADKSQTLDYLEDNIRRVIADIQPQMLEKVIENWTSRLDYIQASRGSPMPEIIFKM